MEELLTCLKEFESRNNISAFITMHSDGTIELLEFWEEDVLKSFKSYTEAVEYLSITKYQLDDNGICIKPITSIN